MKRTRKKILIISITTLVVALQLFSTLQSVEASKIERVVNNCTGIESNQAELLYNTISKNIINKYDGIYRFDNMQCTISNQEIHTEFILVDVDVTTSMTLIKSPKDSQYVKGMEDAIENLSKQNEILLAINRYEEYLEQVMPCYNETIEIGFEYQVKIPYYTKARKLTEDEFVIYHKIETENGDLLTKVEANDQFDEQGNYLAGREDIVQYVQSSEAKVNAARAISFSRAQAVAYAATHATDTPEYNSSNGMGSDCANFVSKCINAGGIPEDTAGKWYRATTAGTYGGDNWIRTGYYNNGGVVPYMKNKGYYAAVSYGWQSTLGSIMYWNTKSHVAMVTRIDGYNILYSHHSNTKKTSTYYLYDSGSDNVTFYVPQI